MLPLARVAALAILCAWLCGCAGLPAAIPYIAAFGAGASGAAALINADTNAIHACHEDGGCKALVPP